MIRSEQIVKTAPEQTLEMTPFAQGVVEKAVEQRLEMAPFAQGVVEKAVEETRGIEQ